MDTTDPQAVIMVGLFILVFVGIAALVVVSAIKQTLQEKKVAQEGYSTRAKILAVKKGWGSKLDSAFVEYQPQLEAMPRRGQVYVNHFKLHRLSPEIREAIGGLENMGEIVKRAKEAKELNSQLKGRGYTKAEISEAMKDKYTSASLARRERAEELGLSLKWEGLLTPVDLPLIVDPKDSRNVVVDYNLLK